MAFARDVYTASAAQTDFTITFPYQAEADVLVYDEGTLQTQGAANDYIFADSTTIRFNSGRDASDTIILQRSTSQTARTVDYTAGALAEADLDNDSIQAFYMAQEAIDIANTAMGKDTSDEWDAETILIHNVVDPVADQDAATKKFVDDSVAAAALGTLTTPISIANGGTASATAAAAFTALKQAASATATGVVELATDAETATGTDTARAVTPANVASAYVKQGLHTIWVPASACKATTTNGAASFSTELATNDIMIHGFDFDATTEEKVQFMLPFSKSWNEGTITGRCRWTGAAGAGGVSWTIAAGAFGNDDALDAALGTGVNSDDTFITANDLHTSPTTAAITVGGTPAEGDLIIVQVSRDVADANDTKSEDARLLGFELFITINAADDS